MRNRHFARAGQHTTGAAIARTAGISNPYPGVVRTTTRPPPLSQSSITTPNAKRNTRADSLRNLMPKTWSEWRTRPRRWAQIEPRFVPDERIPTGDETARLHRWGYNRYREMFNPRQLLGLELSCRLIAETKNERVRHALATNLSDLLRYQNMLCRYDTMSLKSLDIFSVHGFPCRIGPVRSPILLGISNRVGLSVGSGGWSNIVAKYVKAKRYCEAPYEVRQTGFRKDPDSD